MTNNKKNHIPKIHPRHGWVLVKPEDPATSNEYGLSIPDSVEKEQKCRGEILDIGPDVKDLKKGGIVLYGAFAGEPIQLKNKHEQGEKVDYILLLDEDILAVIE